MSYASPEGSVERNDKVSDKRMKSTVKYTRHLLNKLNVEGARTLNFILKLLSVKTGLDLNQLFKNQEIKDKEKISNLLIQ